MSLRTAPWLALALALAVAVPSNAFPIGSQSYAGTTPYAGGLAGMADATILSGRLDATSVASQGPFVALNTTGFSVAGLSRVCWKTSDPLPQCQESPGAGVRIDILPGGSLGMIFPQAASVGISSRHSIALFLNVSQSLDFQGYKVILDRDLAAVHVGAEVTFSDLPNIPVTPIQDLRANNAAGLMLLDRGSRLQVVNQGHVDTLNGNQVMLTFQGKPTIIPFTATATLMPFKTGSTATLVPAAASDAQLGVDFDRINTLQSQLQSSLEQKQGAQPATANPDIAQLKPVLAGILGGALITLPANALSKSGPNPQQSGGASGSPSIGSIVHNITLLRFDTLEATATNSGVALSGSGPLEIQSGRVIGAPSLLGVLPWWCWLLWVAALGLWIARLVVKPAKENERWDKFRWVGWVAAPLVSLLVFWLWDGQVHYVWGLSMLQGGASGAGTYFLLMTEVAIGLIIYLAVVMPLSSLLKSGARFAKQGRFMGLNRPVAMLLGFVLGTTLLLSYIDFLIRFLGTLG